MAFLQTTVTDVTDLLDQLYTFLDSGGDGTWTGIYNEKLSTERQIGLSKGNCEISWGTRTSDRDQFNSGDPGGFDTILSGALATTVTSNPGSETYAGHTGSLVSTEADSDRIRCNDLSATINNVWFFSGTSPVSYCHCIAQVDGDRYTHFSFGTIDPLEQTHTACAYAVGTYWVWWDDGASGNNNPADTDHKIGHFAEDGGNCHIRVTDSSVLPAGFGISAGIHSGNQMLDNHTRTITVAGAWANTVDGKINDFLMALDNQAVTGGTPLFGLPLMVGDTGIANSCWIGNIPDVRMVNIESHAPGETVKFGSEEWLVFPLKRKGALEELQGGASPIALANSSKYGLAYKKVV